jgi:hypothetical protein
MNLLEEVGGKLPEDKDAEIAVLVRTDRSFQL